MTAALEGGEWSAARPSRTLPPGNTRYPFYRRLGGPQGQSGQAENLVPIGIRSRTVQPIVSRYTDWATQPTNDNISSTKIREGTKTANIIQWLGHWLGDWGTMVQFLEGVKEFFWLHHQHTEPPIQQVPATLSFGTEQLGYKCNHQPPSGTKLKNACINTSSTTQSKVLK